MNWSTTSSWAVEVRLQWRDIAIGGWRGRPAIAERDTRPFGPDSNGCHQLVDELVDGQAARPTHLEA